MSSDRPGINPGSSWHSLPQRANPENQPWSSLGPTGQRGGGPFQRNQTCRYFIQGNCRYGTRCHFSHIIPGTEGDTDTRPSSENQAPTATQSPISNFPGLSNDQFSSVGTNLAPGQTFHSLKSYVEDSFRFRTPDQVYGFLDILCSASSQNSSWTAKDGQVHLHQLVQGNGIARLADAIRFPRETTRPWSFQRGYIPIFTYLTSDWVVKSTLHSDVNALYGLVHNNFQTIRDITEGNMRRLMAARSFKDRLQSFSGKHIFKVIFVILFEYLTRFKEAPVMNPGLRDFTTQIVEWFDEWLVGLDSKPPFQDECAAYDKARLEFTIENLRRDKDRVLRVIRRGQTVVVNNDVKMAYQRLSDVNLGLVAALERNFDADGPGELCETGPRHDNDHAEIELIRVAPTRDELLCNDDPYLPANFFEAPHFHDPRSVERLLDIQFRLLREELTSPIRVAVQLLLEDLKKADSNETKLSKILNARGGRYAAPASARESIIFSVFTGIMFQTLELRNNGISAGIEFDTPPGRARNGESALRAEYWEQISKKRLMQDGLVALIWKDHTGNVDVYVGTVASSARDLVECARKEEGQDRVTIRVSFFDAKANIRIVQALQNQHDSSDIRVLIEAPVFYEGIRPFLEALKREPELLPFAQYLRLQSKEELKQTVISPPLYSRTPGFSFELKDLFPPEADVQSLQLTTREPDSVANARAQLIRASRLDPSQAEAMVDSLTREVALIQGPPGTGKSYTGLELIRVLVKNKIAPILLVAFTNHALDHMLNGILDAKITQKIVRLGSRTSMDQRLSDYSLDKLERQEDESRLVYAGKSVYREMKILESQMRELMKNISSGKIPSAHIEQYISFAYPHHHGEFFQHVPAWIEAIAPKPSDSEEGWETVGETPNQEQSIIDFWLDGGDVQFLETKGQNGAMGKASVQVSGSNRYLLPDGSIGDSDGAATRKEFLRDFMRQHDLNSVPKIPNTNRPLDVLLKNPKVWRMSLSERNTLHGAWSVSASDLTRASQVQDFENFRRTHEEVSGQHKEITDQIKVQILARADIVGCTTTGAARLVSLLSGMGPKVMIVEEAGQVLEAHILASLVGTVEHVILIGDPLQLRPNINSYKLSIENPKTGKIYRFDQSLMERLTSSGFPMSQIDVQRRMRPEISSLIRNTLYPNLKDNERVLNYPNVRGMYKNMYFVSHSHQEVGGGEDTVSKHNPFEIDMIHDLVLHLLKQGCYNKPGNIVILAAYLGQIPKLRKKLQDIVTIVIDERDAELLEQHGMDEEAATVQRVPLSKQVIIRTLDNFQGEEGEVIILSLVRNSGTPFNGETSNLEYVKGKAPIGFLRSLNRTNVGLSRAKHGLYIFGNAPELAQGSRMWSDVLKEFRSSECLGPTLPIACHRHPDYIQWIKNPGDLPVVSPKGGCHQPCGDALSCGHICPSLCHADDPNHISTKCRRACMKLCPDSHPCNRECWECSTDVAECRFTITDLQLPCGHTHPPTQCHRVTTPDRMKCPIPVVKQLPSCDHHATMLCHQDPASYACRERVSKKLPQCQHRAILPCSKDPESYLCKERVERGLPGCGHLLDMACHQDPAKFPCPQLMEKKPPCGHPVMVPCHQDIEKYICQIKVEKPLPACSHRAKMPCHQDPTGFVCQERATKILPCNHSVQMWCHEDVKAYKCQEQVEKTFSNCNHRKRLICHQLQRAVIQLCQERVEKEIPTCNHRATMLCHRDPADHKCQQQVEKELPFCQHRALMPCHKDPRTHSCSKPCGGALLCCSGTCSAKCGTCPTPNLFETFSRINTRHAEHMCNRRMACGHTCNTPCITNHICSGPCKDKCQQTCHHSSCHQECSSPCNPCEKPCAWKCVHAECTSPCGMACTRLPCDEKCPNTLSCGHPCPSVCGEPCEHQTCKECSDNTPDSVVDLLRQIHLRDLGDDDTLDSITITLPCRHVFTVETLDSITHIHDFYQQDTRGEWVKAIMPDASYVCDRPVCPHCGGGIDSLRYGRILKHSNHSILQHNIACRLSGQLSRAEALLSNARYRLEREVSEVIHSLGAANIPVLSETARRDMLEKIDTALAANEDFPTNLDIFQNLSKLHGLPPKHAKAWRKAVDKIMESYEIAYGVACELDPSIQQYESSLERLYMEELDRSGGSPVLTIDSAQQRLQQLAGKIAHTRIGHPRPRASDRFTIEALWVTIEIFMLIGLTTSRACEEIWQQNVPGANLVHWDSIAEFLLLRASKDAETAYRLADESKSWNKAILCRLLILQTKYEHASHRCRVAIRNGSLSNRETRDEYLNMCTRNIEQIQGLQASIPRDYQVGVERDSVLGATEVKEEWVEVHFTYPSDMILDAWADLALAIQAEMPEECQHQVDNEQLIIWSPIIQETATSNRESHNEHFYQCPRGHPYTRGECAIALGKIWCPECGIIIGNSN